MSNTYEESNAEKVIILKSDDNGDTWIPDETGGGSGGGGGGGAPESATYLVATANGTLTNEVVVGATPGGELGGTWASPTVDASHSGSTHAAVQAAAEATAAAALATHEADTSTHGVGEVVGRTEVQTLTNKTLTTPTIGSFTNATHNHTNAAGGGTLTSAAIASLATFMNDLAALAEFENAVRANSLDQMTAPAGTVSWNSQKISNLGTPTGANDASQLKLSYAGWVIDSNSWTRTSDTTFTVSGDVTAIFVKGTKVAWAESSTQKYGCVASSSHSTGTTTVTLIATSSYVMAASPDASSAKYSYGKPLDYPAAFLWTPTVSGFSANPTHLSPWWSVYDGFCELNYSTFLNGTSNATSFTVTAPIVSRTGYATQGACIATDNGTGTAARAALPGGSTTITLNRLHTSAWTNSGAKGADFTIRYPL